MTLDARNALIEKHLSLARIVARDYRGMGVEIGDLEQESSVGLIEAARTFDPSLEISFETHARNYLIRRCTQAIHDAGATTVPPKVARTAVACRKARSALQAVGVSNPTLDQIAGQTGLAVSQVELALSLPRARKPAELAELPAPMPDQNTERAAQELWSAAEILSPDDRELLADRYGLGGRPAQGLHEMSSRRDIPFATLKRRLDDIRKRIKIELVRRGWRDRTKPQTAQAQLNIG
jgi:RNA polymerase sigma-B factor